MIQFRRNLISYSTTLTGMLLSIKNGLCQLMRTPQERAKSLLGLVREHADASETQRYLKSEVASAFAREGLFRIAAPIDFFGS